MTAARTYTIGLPVFVTVHDDGVVTYDIDVSEAADAPAAFDPEFMAMYDEAGLPLTVTDAIIDADTARILASNESSTWARTPPPEIRP